MEPSRFRRLIDDVIGVGFIQEGEVQFASVVMPEGEPFRYAVGDLAGYGLEVVPDEIELEVSGLTIFERKGVKGIGFVQTNTGTEIAAISWPEGDPKRYVAIDLAGVGVSIMSSSVVIEPEVAEKLENGGWDHSAETLNLDRKPEVSATPTIEVAPAVEPVAETAKPEALPDVSETPSETPPAPSAIK